jgi:hypothetical protein
MSLLVPDKGERQMLIMALQKATVETQTLKLFVNNYTPVEGSTEASFTEMSTLGYAAKTLARANWTVATDGGGISSAVQPQQVWTFTAGTPVTVYGYYIIETTSGVILWAELLPSPQVVQNNGDVIKITPRIEQA